MGFPLRHPDRQMPRKRRKPAKPHLSELLRLEALAEDLLGAMGLPGLLGAASLGVTAAATEEEADLSVGEVVRPAGHLEECLVGSLKAATTGPPEERM